MADYNIYVHAIGTGGSNAYNPTVPWSAREGGEGSSQTVSQSGDVSGGGAARAIIRAAGYAQNPDSAVGSAFSNALKSIPYVAAAFAVVKLGETIIDNAVEFKALESGDFRSQVSWQNLKTNLNVVFHPFSSSWNSFKVRRQWAREDARASQQRDLLGDSVINSYTNRGV